jgi:hypothetical protein
MATSQLTTFVNFGSFDFIGAFSLEKLNCGVHGGSSFGANVTRRPMKGSSPPPPPRPGRIWLGPAARRARDIASGDRGLMNFECHGILGIVWSLDHIFPIFPENLSSWPPNHIASNSYTADAIVGSSGAGASDSLAGVPGRPR